MALYQLLLPELAYTRIPVCRFNLLKSPTKYAESSFTCPGIFYKHSKLFHKTTQIHQVRKERVSEVSNVKTKQEGQITMAQKVTQAGKDVTYTGVIVVGVAVTGALFYLIGRELLSGQSPSGLYGKALKQCRNHPEVMDELGDPIKGQGEMNRRGRARFVSHLEYEKDGAKHMRIKFYLKGVLRSGTAHLEVKQNDSGKYETRYLFVEVDKYPYKTIIVEDNR